MTRPHDPNCIFCKIIGGEAPAAVIHEDEQTIAFMDVFPSAEGHALVVSKGHYPNVLELPLADLQAAAAVAQRLARAQMQALSPDGVIISQFNGAAAGQTVFHYHIHVVPRWQGQDVNVHGRTQAEPAALQAVAEKLRAALG